MARILLQESLTRVSRAFCSTVMPPLLVHLSCTLLFLNNFHCLIFFFHLSVYLRGPGNAYVIVVNPSSELHPQPWSHIAKLTLTILYSDSLEESDAGICFQNITVSQSSLLYDFEFVSEDRCVCSPVPNLSVIAPLH